MSTACAAGEPLPPPSAPAETTCRERNSSANARPACAAWSQNLGTIAPSNTCAFYFPEADGGAPAAASLDEFRQHLRHCDLNTLDCHLTGGDFSRWVIGTLADHDLSADLVAIERDSACIGPANSNAPVAPSTASNAVTSPRPTGRPAG